MHGGNKEIIKITGMVKNIIFRNKENGYTVFRIKIIDDRHFGEFTCNGYFAAIYPGEIMDLKGFFFMHKLYGEQFKVLSIHKKMPVSEENMQKYLASGIIKGVGNKIAKKIVDKFKKQLLRCIKCAKIYRLKI